MPTANLSMPIKTTQDSIEIGPASRADIPALCQLLAILFSQEVEFQADQTVQASALTSLFDNPELGTLLIARDGTRPIAMVSLLYTVSTALGGRVALLEDMLVHPDYRNRAIGSQLLSHAVTVAREQGCRRITLLTDRENSAAQGFYRRQGFALSEMVPMRLLLD
jgi:GNAT superfamily N-acetyltransferase